VKERTFSSSSSPKPERAFFFLSPPSSLAHLALEGREAREEAVTAMRIEVGRQNGRNIQFVVLVVLVAQRIREHIFHE